MSTLLYNDKNRECVYALRAYSLFLYDLEMYCRILQKEYFYKLHTFSCIPALAVIQYIVFKNKNLYIYGCRSEEMKLTTNAKTVLERRYIAKDQHGAPTETVEGLFHRVAHAVADADHFFDQKADTAALEKTFYQMMTHLEFLPNSPTLMNAGKELGQLSACFVLPVSDSMEAIFEAIKQAALIHKSGGGTGFSFSRLRPKGSTVRSTGGIASGPISFMRVFNMATEAVKQGGTRRGANMGILRVDHPDILEFIDCKQENTEIQNFNISIGITERFMQAVESGESYALFNPQNASEQVGTLDARDVFSRIVQGAWSNGEPGIIFLDRLNKDHPVPEQGEIESTNPCGEQPLLPYESCNLGSVNLSVMLRKTDDGYAVDYDKLRNTVHRAVHFLDNVIEINQYPLQQIEETTKLTRKIGLGVMGFADMLLLLGLPYNSPEGIAMGEEVMQFIQQEAHQASEALAEVRGPFPLFSQSIYQDQAPIRNATVTTIAPTGTLSIIAGCSSGVEPVFAYAYTRNIMDGDELIEVNPILQRVLQEHGLYSETLMRQIIAEGTLAHLSTLPADLRRLFVCAHDISPQYHIQMQAAFQRYTDNAVSKTVNFASDATVQDVESVFLLAYQLGCKGVTIYRDGSRDLQTLSIGKIKGKPEAAQASDQTDTSAGSDCPADSVIPIVRPRPRAESMKGLTKRVKIGCGNLYVTVNYDQHGICEVFTSTGKAGGCPSQSEATARLASIALRSGIDIDYVVKQMRGIRCPSTIRRPNMKCTSCPDAIARVISEVHESLKNASMLPSDAHSAAYRFCPLCGECLRHSGASTSCAKCGFETEHTHPAEQIPSIEQPEGENVCPECAQKLEHEGGCVACRSCGFSKCN